MTDELNVRRLVNSNLLETITDPDAGKLASSKLLSNCANNYMVLVDVPCVRI